MKASVTYQEADRLLANKTGQDITLAYCGESSRVKVLFHGITLYLKVESVSDDEIVLSHQVGQDIQPIGLVSFFRRGAQVVAQETVNKLLEGFVKNPAVAVCEDRTVRVKLSEIEQLKGALQNAVLNDVWFEEREINMDIILL